MNDREQAEAAISMPDREHLAEWFFNSEVEYDRWPQDAAIQPYCRWAYKKADMFLRHFQTGPTTPDKDIPLCADHAQSWFTERNLLASNDCVVCAFATPQAGPPAEGGKHLHDFHCQHCGLKLGTIGPNRDGHPCSEIECCDSPQAGPPATGDGPAGSKGKRGWLGARSESDLGD